MYSNIPTYVLVRWANDTDRQKINKAWVTEIDAELQRRHEEVREELEEFEALEALS